MTDVEIPYSYCASSSPNDLSSSYLGSRLLAFLPLALYKLLIHRQSQDSRI